jgi:hypothetical protein
MLARGVPIAIGRKPASAAAERIWSGTPEQSSNRKRNVAAPKVYKIKIGNKNVNRYDKLIRQNPSNPLNPCSFSRQSTKTIQPKPIQPKKIRLIRVIRVPFLRNPQSQSTHRFNPLNLRYRFFDTCFNPGFHGHETHWAVFAGAQQFHFYN